MNVSLKDATVQGNDDRLYHFNDFFVKARNIRYVQIPEDVITCLFVKYLCLITFYHHKGGYY